LNYKICIKESIKNSGSVAEILNDSTIVLKLIANDDEHHNQCTDTYIFVNYLPPINSTYYTYNDVDLFSVLEDTLCKYNEQGNVIAFGDFNSRTCTGVSADLIENDRLNDAASRM